MSGTWRPEIRIVKNRHARVGWWRVELGSGLILASNGPVEAQTPAGDLTLFIGELKDAIATAHELNMRAVQ